MAKQKMDFVELSEQKLALFNSAMGVTIRINELLNSCVYFSSNRLVVQHYKALISLQKEIWPKISKPDQKQTDEKLNTIYCRWISRIESDEESGEDVKIPRILIHELDLLEKDLRVLADKAE